MIGFMVADIARMADSKSWKEQLAFTWMTSSAKGKLESSQMERTSAGVKTTCRIRNVGKAGRIFIRVTCSCSEGEWTQFRTVTFGEYEFRTLEFSFREPSIDAKGLQSWYQITP
jgi:hypothetical protein